MFNRDFDGRFERTQRRIGKMAVVAFVFAAIVYLAVIGGIGCVVFLLLRHFGVIG